MYCKNCGTELEEGQKFCPNCGTPVNSETNDTSYEYQRSEWQNRSYQQDIPGRSDAIVSMVFGSLAIICWFFGPTSILSIVFAIIGLVFSSTAKKKGYTGDMQTAGFVLSLVSLFGGILIFIACIACTGLGIASLSLTY